MFLYCDLKYGFNYHPQFLLSHDPLEIPRSKVKAGAGARAGEGAVAGAGSGSGADKNTFMNTDLALFVVFGLIHITCGFLKKRRNYFNCSPKQD